MMESTFKYECGCGKGLMTFCCEMKEIPKGVMCPRCKKERRVTSTINYEIEKTGKTITSVKALAEKAV